MAEASKVPVITIDGPSGSGKGTVARSLAKLLGWHVLDSGALYRLLALAAFWRQIPLEDAEQISELSKELNCAFLVDGENDILLEGKKVNKELRSEAVGNAASKIAIYPAVRMHLLARQRAFAVQPGLVADGRDMGTVVFPKADCKFYLDASVEERARRRALELHGRGIDVSLESLCLEIEQRDKRDKERVVAPLKAAEDATLIDSTKLSVSQTVWQMLCLLKERKPYLLDLSVLERMKGGSASFQC